MMKPYLRDARADEKPDAAVRAARGEFDPANDDAPDGIPVWGFVRCAAGLLLYAGLIVWVVVEWFS
jgi:hypothetical protein